MRLFHSLRRRFESGWEYQFRYKGVMRLFVAVALLLGGCASAPRGNEIHHGRAVSRYARTWEARRDYCALTRCLDYAGRSGNHYRWSSYDEQSDQCICVMDTPYGEERPFSIPRVSL